MTKKILVIEDEKDIQELLQLYLKREGYDVQIAKEGETGLRKACKERYDLVLLDLLLPQHLTGRTYVNIGNCRRTTLKRLIF
jgi:DNA-binding response OmpR family regulator